MAIVIPNPTQPGDPQGYYAGLSDLYNEFGPIDIAIWSNADGNPPTQAAPTPNMTRIQQALNYADREINDYFQNVYVTPLVIPNGPSPVVTQWACNLAASWLYTSIGRYETVPSGAPNGQKQVNRFDAVLSNQYGEMLNYLNPSIRYLGAPLKVSLAPATSQ